MNDYSDEVSLRDLYLIFKRGFPLIVLVALVAGAAAFLYATLQPDKYEAQATVLVTATPERQSDGAGSSIIQRTNVNYATYESIAFSRRVLEATAREASSIEIEDYDTLEEMLELESLVSRSEGSSQLIVGHTARLGDAAD
ncbi:MAG TPA: Wzz/FepE/Etk N-terminal domain-containing protein, partial [Deinococcales bacterium]|nr:Wzz/FepE/Etk N-terminal domain-containing protein [Deinococcales bacterium]